MSLRPCPACRRHVASVAVHCVFCAAALPAGPARRPELPGRFARAAVFAGATLASACVVIPEPPAQAPATTAGPPGGTSAGDGTTAGPPGGGFAQPPPGGGSPGGGTVTPPPVAQLGALEMTVRGAGQQPAAGARVQLVAPGGARQELVADGAGSIRVAALAPGQYQILFWLPAGARDPRATVVAPQKRVVMVIPNTTTQLVLALPGDVPQVAPDPDYERRHEAMPYGAPPARRRVV